MKYGKTTFTEYTGDYDSPSESYETDQSTATQIVDVTPGTVESRRQAALDFLGYAVVKAAQGLKGASVDYISRVAPMPYVDDSRAELGNLNKPLYCTAVTRGKGIGAASKNPKFNASDYPTYRMWLRFDALPQRVDAWDMAIVAPADDPTNPLAGLPDEGQALANGNPRYIVRHPDWATASPAVRGSILFYVDDANAKKTPLNEAQHIQDNYLVLQYQWLGVPRAAVPRTAILKQENTVNNAVFDGFPRWTMLFGGCREIPRVGPLGDDLSDVTYLFKVIYHNSNRGNGVGAGFPWGWRGVWRNFKNVLDIWGLSSDGTISGRFMYDESDFRLLFQPPQA